MRVAVVGAGIVGLACAEELVRGGHDVRVFDPAPAQGATHAAAGMISPGGEAWHGEEALLRLGLASARLWPEYAARLGEATGTDVDYRRHGTLLTGRDHDDLQVLERSLGLLEANGVAVERLDRDEVACREPTLSRTVGGAFLADEHSVDPRHVAAALARLVGGRLVRQAARPVVTGDRCLGVLTDDGARHEADIVVVATGARIPDCVPFHDVVRPVTGEIVRARTDDPPRVTVRAVVHGEPVYVVPRAGGEVVIGATSEEHAGEPRPTVGGVTRLLATARTLMPVLDRAEILDVTARHRPGTPDNGPLLGPTGVDGLLLAAGHYRGGVLLAPVTAQAVRAQVEGGPVPEAARHFTPGRFERPRSRT